MSESDTMMKKETIENDFSIELNSNRNLTRISASNDARSVIIEGNLGKLCHASFVDNVILEVKGSNGTLRLSLRKEDLNETATAKRAIQSAEVK